MIYKILWVRIKCASTTKSSMLLALTHFVYGVVHNEYINTNKNNSKLKVFDH